jgi:hypothetical protein
MRRSALLFVAIGLAIYAALFYASERLVYATGKSNALFKVATAPQTDFDWVILGASHAMPLDFADFNGFMERETGQRILNLASPGTGPLYNRFVLEHFLSRHRTRNLLYVVDSFAFYAPAWNEERFADAKLLRRTPLDTDIARRLLAYCRLEGVDPRALLDYASGFSKINNRERFEPDIWEGEKQFERQYRPSAAATRDRIAYLYPQPPDPAVLARFLEVFKGLIAVARRHDVRVVAIKMPVPSQFLDRLPDEAAFDAAMLQLLGSQQVELYNFARAMDAPRFYFDTDHLNRTGLTEFFNRHLKAVLQDSRRDGNRPAPESQLDSK